MRHSLAIYYMEGFDREELSPALRSRLERHLTLCQACAARNEKTAQLSHFVQKVRSADLRPQGFESALEQVRQGTLRTIRQQEPARTPSAAFWIERLVRLPGAVPVALGAALLVALLLRQGSWLEKPVAPAGGTVASKSAAKSPREFTVVRDGREVKIEWPHNGTQHRIRTAADPVSVKVAGGQLVRGKVWSDGENQPVPGNITYYLID